MNTYLDSGGRLAKIVGGFMLAVISMTVTAQTPPADPNTFLTFLEHFQIEDTITAKAYYKAIDPNDEKVTAEAWARKAGFLSPGATYVSSGTPGNPGDDEAKSKAFAFALYRNAADLGFVRRMFIRCNPANCTGNPDIYSYVENYFYCGDALHTFGANGVIPACPVGVDPYADGKNRTNRVASVMFDWKAAADGSNPTKKFGSMYTYAGPAAGGNDSRLIAGVEFAPNLDGRGDKQQPGACSTCHGGFPKALVNGAYPNNGELKGFKFLPFDEQNFEFPDEDGLRQADQTAQFKKFNRAVLLTHKGKISVDDQGVSRIPAGKELIEGWYGGNLLATNTNPFNKDFIPKGWREAPNGSAPAGSENLYKVTIEPACRACHVQQELSLDLATQKGFMSHAASIKELVLRIECGLGNDPVGTTRDDRKVMPLALLTYARFWQNDAQVDTLKNYLGMPGTTICNNGGLLGIPAP